MVETEIEFSIGHFARLTRLTVRALRHYDDIGLLHPVRVDPRSGYRYYRPGQLKTATTIAVMRALDLDVPTIRGILTGATDVTEIIAAERTRRQRDAIQAEAALALLDHMDKPLWSDDHQPKVTDISPFQIVGRNLRVGSDDEYRVVAVAFEDLFAWADQEGISNDGDGICVIHAAAHDQLHLTIGVRPEIDMTGVGLPRNTVVVDIEGGPTAVALCRGPLQSLPVAHATLTDWVYNQQRRPNGSARETYLGSLEEQQTRIDIPLAP
ncbi:MAG: MerR family transcriptional regulator [Actinobacteria bacterium]|nr:MerR family transcriptional regulator [Actinomycetota bacterium]